MAINEFGNRLPEETDEEKKMREQRQERVLALRGSYGGAAYQFGPRPSEEMALQPSIDTINPVPEITTGLAPVEQLPWGGTMRPATESTGYGEKRFSNIPEDVGRADTTFITEAPKKAEKNVRDFSNFNEEDFTKYATNEVETAMGIKINKPAISIAMERNPGYAANSPKVQEAIKQVADEQAVAYKRVQDHVSRALRDKAVYDAKQEHFRKSYDEQEEKRKKEIDDAYKLRNNLLERRERAVMSLNKTVKNEEGPFGGLDEDAKKAVESLDQDGAIKYLKWHVQNLDSEMDRLTESYKLKPFAARVEQSKDTGIIEPGNIDLSNLPIVKNADGTISTVKSKSFNIGGQEVLLPTIAENGDMLSDKDAVNLYKKTGKHLGKFKSPETATAYAKQLSGQQGAKILAEPVRDKSGGVTYTNPEQVRTDLKLGKLTRDEARKIILQMTTGT